MGRLRAAVNVLLGREQTHWQQQREWIEIKVEAAGMFDRFNALASRLVKAQKAIESQAEKVEQLPAVPTDKKAHLRTLAAQRKVAGARGRVLQLPITEIEDEP